MLTIQIYIMLKSSQRKS